MADSVKILASFLLLSGEIDLSMFIVALGIKVIKILPQISLVQHEIHKLLLLIYQLSLLLYSIP